jgi:thioredoxin-like negative regulator of GroEL
MTPFPAAKALDAYFLEARSKLLDLAAILDRIDRGADAPAAASDPRLHRVRQALGVLLNQGKDRAEAVQQLFSLEYDPHWPRPEPR